MPRRILLLTGACAALLLAGWATVNVRREGVALTAATAKAALVEMLQRTDDTDIQRYLELLKQTEPIIEDDGRTVRLGPLECDIPARRFNLLIVSVDERDFIDWSGTFVRQGGKWIAMVEEKRQT